MGEPLRGLLVVTLQSYFSAIIHRKGMGEPLCSEPFSA